MDYITVSTQSGFVTEGLQQNYKTNSFLPIILLSFTATKNESSVDLNWITSVEINNNYFSIERSSDTINFIEIGQIKGAGNSNRILEYTYIDRNPIIGVSYYRLKQIDYNGKYQFSNIAPIYFDLHLSDVSIYPNPFSENTYLYLKGFNVEDISYQIHDVNGKILITGKANREKTLLNLEELTSGIYFIQIYHQGNIIKREIIIKNQM